MRPWTGMCRHVTAAPSTVALGTARQRHYTPGTSRPSRKARERADPVDKKRT